MFFRSSEEELGKEAKLGISFYLLDKKGEVIAQDGYHEDTMLPMASTKKVAIALVILKKVYADKEFSLSTEINIENIDFSAGRPTNSLDRYFFMPWSIRVTKTIDELLTYMLTESDNTSTDVLLDLVGGSKAVNQLIEELNIDGHYLSFSSKVLLGNYFGLSTEKSIGNILKTLYEFISAYSMRATEKLLVQSEEDACTPKMMSHLLGLLVSKPNTKDHWLDDATEILFTKMQQCKTGDTLIKKGVNDFSPYINRFGSKQGGLGGIRNDTAFIHFKDGSWAILSIHTCQSSLSLRSRDVIISNLAKKILVKHCDLLEDKFDDKDIDTLCDVPQSTSQIPRCNLF